MPITEGFSHYECEVACCERNVFAQSGNIAAAGYIEVRFIDSTGVERKMVLCGEHGENFHGLAEQFDKAYDEFSRTGEVVLTSKSEVAKLQADLADMTKKRDQWHNKFKEMEAKYNALIAESDGE